jgi:hypothetical protein
MVPISHERLLLTVAFFQSSIIRLERSFDSAVLTS